MGLPFCHDINVPKRSNKSGLERISSEVTTAGKQKQTECGDWCQDKQWRELDMPLRAQDDGKWTFREVLTMEAKISCHISLLLRIAWLSLVYFGCLKIS